MRCAMCNGDTKVVKGDYSTRTKGLGEIEVPDISRIVCQECSHTLLEPSEVEKMQTYLRDKEKEIINSLPVGEFISTGEAVDILGITKQAFSKNPTIKRGFIYCVKIGERKIFHRKSVELFKEKADGRFLLKDIKPESPTVNTQISIPRPQMIDHAI